LGNLSLESSLAQQLERTTTRYPHRVFIQFEKRKITFRQFNALANQFASYLRDQKGLKSGDKVSLFAQNSPEFAISFFAVQKTGGIVVPVNTFFKQEECAFVIEDSESRLVLVSDDLVSTAKKANELLSHSVELILIQEVIPKLSPKQVPNPKLNIEPNDVAAFIYTSGTTGKPKGAMLTHKNFISNIVGACEAFDLSHRDRFLAFLPLFHSFSLTVLLLLPSAIGARIILIGSVKDTKKILRGFFWDRATIMAGIPHVYDLLSRKKIPFFLRWLMRLRFCISGAAALSEATLRRFEKNWKKPLIEGYGLSETSPVVSFNPPKGVRKVLSVGLPLANVKVKIVDEAGQTLSPNKEGEICVQGPNVMQGYYKQEKATAEVLREGWLHTGDLGKIDEDGYIYIVDRKKDLIIVRGINVYPREVEEVLKHNPKVKECAVVGVTDPKRGEMPVAHVVLNDKQKATEKELRDWCRPHLANYKIPHKITFHKDLPRTSTGKILKRALRE